MTSVSSLAPPVDLLALTGDLINITSVSFEEQVLVAHLEEQLRAIPWLETHRIGDNLVARTNLGHAHRILIGGHSDTVPVNGANNVAVFEPRSGHGETVRGLGASDMKGGVAVIMALAAAISEPAVDVTYLIYAREEVAAQHNGLAEVQRLAPELLDADVAILGEPTCALLEAGCQGTMRMVLSLKGARAHTARAWMGRNAIHRLGTVLAAIDAYEARTPTIDGCTYHEAVQAVFVDGGVAGNVVPDEVTLTVGHRFAPDRTPAEAEAFLRSILEPHMEEGDTLELTDMSPPAAPSLTHPLLSSLVNRNQLTVKAKLGWTDVAFFYARGVPAANFGPGDPTLAHTAGEWVSRDSVESAWASLSDLLINGV